MHLSSDFAVGFEFFLLWCRISAIRVWFCNYESSFVISLRGVRVWLCGEEYEISFA